MGFAVGASFMWATNEPIRQLANAAARQHAVGTLDTDRRDESVWHWITHDAAGFFTLWLIIVPGGQLLLFGGQIVLIRQSLTDAKAAADAAKAWADTAKIQANADKTDLQRMQDTAVRQLRAYVFPEAVTLRKENVWLYDVSFKNFGQTPAYDFSQFTASAVADERAAKESLVAKREGPTSRTTLPPRHSVRTTKSQPVTAAEAADIQSGRKCFYVFGELQYIDAFGRFRTTRFRYMHNKDCGPTELIACELGNDEI